MNFGTKSLTLLTCQNIQVSINCHTRGAWNERTVVTANLVTVTPLIEARLPIKVRGKRLLLERDYSFVPRYSSQHNPLRVYNHIVDASMSFIKVRNYTTRSVILSKGTKLGRLTEFKKEHCHLVDEDREDVAVLAL